MSCSWGYLMEGLRPLFRYFELSGRTGRAEFWKFCAFVLMAETLAAFLDTGSNNKVPVITSIIVVVTTIPQWTATVRRLHDIGKSGWAMLWPIGIAAIGAVVAGMSQQVNEYGEKVQSPIGLLAILLILGSFGYGLYLLTKAGNEYENQYGDPDNYVPTSFAELTGKSIDSADRPISGPRPAPKVGGMDEAMAQIERLGQLREKGLLSEEEFAAQKSAILSRV